MRKQAALLVVLLIAPTAAFAAETHFYFGGSLGEKAVLFESSEFDADVDDQPYKLFGGLGLGDHLGFELAYHDFATQVCCAGVADYGYVLDVDGYSAAVVAKLPVRRFALFGKLGYLLWDEDGERISIAGPESVSRDGGDLMGGAGATFSITDHFAARLEWETFKFDDDNADAFSAGIQYRF
ncbi:MAG: porin family protein [bacterium]|nr:porin family protein [bacterium]